MSRLYAPWTPEQVDALNAWQACGVVHPFTSDEDENGNPAPKVDLLATPDGWVRKEGGPVVQTWAHDFLADPDTVLRLIAAHEAFAGAGGGGISAGGAA